MLDTPFPPWPSYSAAEIAAVTRVLQSGRVNYWTGDECRAFEREFVAQEEMDRFDGYWWSPDSSRIVYQETDTEALEIFTIADPVNPDKEVQTWPYPRPGKANAKVRLFVADVVNGADGFRLRSPRLTFVTE